VIFAFKVVMQNDGGLRGYNPTIRLVTFRGKLFHFGERK
jgi:hypothetical protein